MHPVMAVFTWTQIAVFNRTSLLVTGIRTERPSYRDARMQVKNVSFSHPKSPCKKTEVPVRRRLPLPFCWPRQLWPRRPFWPLARRDIWWSLPKLRWRNRGQNWEWRKDVEAGRGRKSRSSCACGESGEPGNGREVKKSMGHGAGQWNKEVPWCQSPT